MLNRKSRFSRTIASGLWLAGVVALPALIASPASAQDKMSDGKMSGSKMSGSKMMKPMKGMTMAQSKMMGKMMMGLSAADKRAMMGMSMSEKRAMMNSMKMNGKMAM